MNKQFSQDDLITPEQHEINSLILEQASDNAERFTELECKKLDIDCWVEDVEEKNSVFTFTEEAQEIFDNYYDQQVIELYNLLNAQLKIIQK